MGEGFWRRRVCGPGGGATEVKTALLRSRGSAGCTAAPILLPARNLRFLKCGAWPTFNGNQTERLIKKISSGHSRKKKKAYMVYIFLNLLFSLVWCPLFGRVSGDCGALER